MNDKKKSNENLKVDLDSMDDLINSNNIKELKILLKNIKDARKSGKKIEITSKSIEEKKKS